MLRPEDCIPGTLVECIRSAGTILVRGRIYEIEAYIDRCIDPFANECGDGIDLIGVEEICEILRSRCCYGLSRFRRIPDERLSIFRAMLAPAPQKERV